MKTKKNARLALAGMVLLAALAAGVMAVAQYSIPVAAGTALVIAAGTVLGVRRAFRAGKEEGAAPASETTDGYSLGGVLLAMIGFGAIYGLVSWTSTFSAALAAAIVVCTVSGFLVATACSMVLGAVSTATRRALPMTNPPVGNL